MASNTLTLYKDNVATNVFSLVSSSADGVLYKVGSRDLSLPHIVMIQRKLTAGNSVSNDHVIVRLSLTGRNSTTAKLSTGSVAIDISIPKDTGTVTKGHMTEMLGNLASLLNDSTTLAGTFLNRSALLEGRDL